MSNNDNLRKLIEELIETLQQYEKILNDISVCDINNIKICNTSHINNIKNSINNLYNILSKL